MRRAESAVVPASVNPSRLLSRRALCILTRIGQVNGECQQDAAPTFHVGVIMDGNGRWAEARGLAASRAMRAAPGG